MSKSDFQQVVDTVGNVNVITVNVDNLVHGSPPHTEEQSIGPKEVYNPNNTVEEHVDRCIFPRTVDVLGTGVYRSNTGEASLVVDPTNSPPEPQSSPDCSNAVDSSSLVIDDGSNATNDNSCDAVSESMLCLVCGDKGSGYHYSVYSCEGCKGFFKRSVQKNLAYNCKYDNSCPINRFSRNACQSCRFERCVIAGMRREAVRDDRTPGGKHRTKRQRTSMDYMTSIQIEPYKDDLAQALIDARPDLVPSDDGGVSPSHDIEPLPISSINVSQLMNYGYSELKLIIQWARKVPEFTSLDMPDQMTLLKGAFMELNVLRLSYRSLDLINKLKFANDIIMSEEEAAGIGWGSDLPSCNLDFVKRLREVSIDHTEFCILNAIVLTYPDAAGIKNKESVTNLQTKMLDSLRKYIAYHYPHEPRRYGKMLLRLPALRTISAKAAERFLSLSLDGKIQITALVAEMMS